MSGSSLELRLARALDLVGDQGHPTDANGLPVRNAPSPLGVFIPFIRARGERKRRRLAAAPQAVVADAIDIAADETWHETGHVVRAGERVRLTASGRLFLSKPLEVSIGPRICLWYRIGDGPIARMKTDEQIIEANADGSLRVQAALPGAFDSPQGEVSIENPPPPMSGTLQLRIQKTDAEPDTASEPPDGWQYFWRIGEGAIFKTCEDDASLCCDTHGDGGILQYPVDMALTPGLQLQWDWQAEALPSSLPEHVQPTHDYLSIAIEFDNGLDLTYMWSSRLPKDCIFQCPLPWWDQRETHWVLRRPEDGLGQWLSESRGVLADYQKAIGGELPQRVVALWLIANSAFQSGRGSCRYRKILLLDKETVKTVHP